MPLGQFCAVQQTLASFSVKLKSKIAKNIFFYSFTWLVHIQYIEKNWGFFCGVLSASGHFFCAGNSEMSKIFHIFHSKGLL